VDYCYPQEVQGESKSLTLQYGVCFLPKAETNVSSPTDSEEETIVLAAKSNVSLMAGTRSGQSYLKKYDEMVTNSLKPTPEPTKQSMKQPVEKQKVLRYAKALSKDKAEGSLRPYHFDILTQLANIPARITFYELLRLSKSTREALREVLTDAEAFMAWISAEQEEDEENYLHASQHAPLHNLHSKRHTG